MRQAILCGILAGCGMFPWGTWAEVDHAISLSVVQVRASPGTGKVFFGSGVVVGPDQVVTNCHVTRSALKIMVSKGAMLYPAVSQQADTRHDLCLLEVPGIPFPSAQLGSAERLTVGQPLYFYGYPHGIGIAFTEGRVRALHPFEGGQVIETSADFTFGGSGGGFFDGNGRLVGLATFLAAALSTPRTGPQGGGYYAIPSDWIRTLKSREAHKIEPLQGLTFWEDTAGLPAFLRVPGR